MVQKCLAWDPESKVKLPLGISSRSFFSFCLSFPIGRMGQAGERGVKGIISREVQSLLE